MDGIQILEMMKHEWRLASPSTRRSSGASLNIYKGSTFSQCSEGLCDTVIPLTSMHQTGPSH